MEYKYSKKMEELAKSGRIKGLLTSEELTIKIREYLNNGGLTENVSDLFSTSELNTSENISLKKQATLLSYDIMQLYYHTITLIGSEEKQDTEVISALNGLTGKISIDDITKGMTLLSNFAERFNTYLESIESLEQDNNDRAKVKKPAPTLSDFIKEFKDHYTDLSEHMKSNDIKLLERCNLFLSELSITLKDKSNNKETSTRVLKEGMELLLILRKLKMEIK